MATPRVGAHASSRRATRGASRGGGTPGALAAAAILSFTASASGEEPDALPPVVVVGTTPVLGSGVDARRLPSNVQRLGPQEISENRPLGLSDLLRARVGGAIINEVQGNPLQPDVSFRGFSASPLLGVPQGLSVYQNGVRVNDAFGDTVQWDLVPEFAIAAVDVLPGSNPVYGLNTLGGALALRMKDGFRYRGAHLSTEGGSFGRVRSLLESGGSRGDFAVYGAAEAFGELGFRDHSPSAARRLYTDVRHRGKAHEVGVSLTAVNNELRGNGPLPLDLLRRDRSAVYTYPDLTDNRMALLSLDGDLQVSDSLSLQGTAYVRRLSRHTLNADEAPFAPCATSPGLLCDPTSPLVDTNGAPIPASIGGDGAVNTTTTGTTALGAALQATWQARTASTENHLTAGATVDGAPIDFSRGTEVGVLQTDREIAPAGVRLSGDEFRTRLSVGTVAMGTYVTDTLTVARRISVTGSGRLNVVALDLNDRDGAALDGSHQFLRVNPALGVAYHPSPSWSLFGGYGESNRAPTAAELACSDPAVPCRIPNAFLSDPPLKQVVSRSAELGARGDTRFGPRSTMSWSVALFGSRSTDDILFVAGDRVGTGYFRNAGATQRLGAEARATSRIGRFATFVRYQLLRATFETSLTLPGDNHPDATLDAAGRSVIRVEPGDTMPAMPVHSVKVGAGVFPIPRLWTGISALGSSSQVFRGDESNQLAPVPGYVVLEADVSYGVSSQVTVFARARNLLGTNYETFGVLGDATGVIPAATNPRFLSPGAPLGAWLGIDVAL